MCPRWMRVVAPNIWMAMFPSDYTGFRSGFGAGQARGRPRAGLTSTPTHSPRPERAAVPASARPGTEAAGRDRGHRWAISTRASGWRAHAHLRAPAALPGQWVPPLPPAAAPGHSDDGLVDAACVLETAAVGRERAGDACAPAARRASDAAMRGRAGARASARAGAVDSARRGARLGSVRFRLGSARSSVAEHPL